MRKSKTNFLSSSKLKKPVGIIIKKWRIMGLIAVLLLVGLGSAVVWHQAADRLSRPNIHDTTIVTDDALLKRYIKAYGPEKAIALVKSVPSVDCHQRSHKIGRLNYELIGANAFKVLNSECQSGYTHGVTEAFFRDHGTDNLSHNLTVICQNEQNGFYAHQCFHGIGHGLMAFFDYDLPTALKTCDSLEDRPQINKESCYSGVFMENVVGAIGIDEAKKVTGPTDYHTSSYLSSDPLYPCDSIDNHYKSTCYFFQSSRMLQVLGQDFQAIAANCEKIEPDYQFNCFSSTGRDVSNNFGNRYADIEKSCGYAHDVMFQLACVGGAAQDKFWDQSEEDEALALCRGLSAAAYKERCYKELTDRSRDIIAKPADRQAFCAKYETNYVGSCTAI